MRGPGKFSFRFLLTGLLFVAVELEAEGLSPMTHGVEGARGGDLLRPTTEELATPSGALDCSQSRICPTTQRTARCEMSDLYRRNAHGVPQFIDSAIVVTADNYCLALKQICEVARKRPAFQSSERPIYCFEPGDKQFPAKHRLTEARDPKTGIFRGVVSVVTGQQVDLERVKDELHRIGMLGASDITDSRSSGNGFVIQERVEPGDEAAACERVSANAYLKSAIQSCTTVGGRELSLAPGKIQKS